MQGWLTCPVIGDGHDFPLDKAGEPIVTTDRGPFRAAVAEREAVEGDRLEFVIDSKQVTWCLVAYDVADDSNFPDHEGEPLLAEADLDKAADRVEEADSLEALAQGVKVGKAGSAREVLRRIGQTIEPTFDERSYLGEADAPPTGSFLEDTMTGAEGPITGHTGEKGATWTKGSESESTPKLDGGGYAVRAGTGVQLYQYAYASGAPASADYTVECGIYCSTILSASRKNGPVGRINTAADTSYQWVWETGEGYELLKSVAGVKTTLATYAREGTAGKEDVAVLSMVGAAIKGFVNGVERGSATDSAISAAGKAGFRVNGTVSTGGKINYIIATDAKKPQEFTLESTTETDSALPFSVAKSLALVAATETDSAQALAIAKALALPVALEEDEARELVEVVEEEGIAAALIFLSRRNRIVNP